MSSTATLDQTTNTQSNSSLEEQSKPKEVQTPSTPSKALEMKGSMVPMTHLEINTLDLGLIRDELSAKTSQAPDFFKNLPVVLSFERLQKEDIVDFDALIDTCKQFSIKPVAIRGGTTSLQDAAQIAGLAVMPKQKERAEATQSPQSDNKAAAASPAEKQTPAEPAAEKERAVIQKERQISKVVHHPIRSGQQVYAADGDLVILASVSAGAEILADGNIHVYGTLRGRALAGVKGNANARIFCQSMEAELVSVAGQYKISEDIGKEYSGKPTQVYLQDDLLKLKELEL